MKKLNRKGFTLEELLAVIVILENSRKKAFDTAVETISNYIQDQKDMSLLSADLRGSTYNSTIGEAESGDGSTGNLLTTTGYSKNITAIKWKVENGVVKIECATANESGDYRQSSNYSVCE